MRKGCAMKRELSRGADYFIMRPIRKEAKFLKQLQPELERRSKLKKKRKRKIGGDCGKRRVTQNLRGGQWVLFVVEKGGTG